MSKLREIARFGRTVWRTYRARGLWRRAVHEVRRAVGGYQHAPRVAIDSAVPLPANSIYAPHGSFARLASAPRILERGARVVAGSYEAFGHAWRAFPATADAWSTTVTESYRFPRGPWWTVPHLPAQADIKEVWEPARFGWVYDLIRARQLRDDPAIAETFRRRFEEWMQSSPPFAGAHWSCGQEIAIRALALLHGEAALPPTENRVAADLALTRALAWSGERIEDAIGYGLSQRNNHGISESAALLHLGLRLRGQHRRADSWLTIGRRLLDEQIQDQFLEDGWYAQHSFYYMRVALEQALLAQRALERVGLSLDARSIARLCAAVDLIIAVIDARTGLVPNFGANDGSRVLPLSSASYRDFRPLLTLAALTLRRAMPADIPADPDVLAWIGGELPPPSQGRVDGVCRGSSAGWVVIRHRGMVAFLRAGEYQHRPSHLDLLHLNLSADGRELIVDPGTFAYNGVPPWKNGLAVASVHNGPILDDQEPAAKGPRFLWRDWPSSRIVAAEARPDDVVVIAEVPDRLRREVKIRRGKVIVTDTVLDPQVHTVQVTWLLHPDVADANIVHADGACDLRPRNDAIDGWFSPSYLQRVPTRAFRVRRERIAGQPLQIRASIGSPASSAQDLA